MSFIFKKLSVILCCLFGLIFINPVTLANPYLVYFFKNDEYNVLKCSACEISLFSRAEESCTLCNCNCRICADEIENGKICHCNYTRNKRKSFVNKYGPFCFIECENAEYKNVEAVFKDAKKSNKLFCLSCVLKKIDRDWYVRIFTNINAKLVDINEIFDLNALINVNEGLCSYHSKILQELCGLKKPQK